MINKKGASLSSWTEASIGILIIVGCLAIIIVDMNMHYSQNYDPTFGLSSNSTRQSLEAYQGTLQSGMQGEASTNAITGISLGSSWQMVRAGLNMVWDFVSGQWIMNAVALLQFGSAGTLLGTMLRLLFVFSIGFILLKILFKVKP